MNIQFSKFSFLILAAGLLLTSCSSSTESSSEQPPQVPPTESMTVDISEMQNAKTQSTAKAVESNFSSALVAGSLAKLILQANLALPQALLASAQNQSAEFENGEWVWEYNSGAQGNTFGVKLAANVESEQNVNWNFFITNSALNMDDQLFFSGSSDFEATAGTWTYYSLDDEEEISTITWERGEDMASVILEVTSDRNDRVGDSISYDFDGNTKTVVYLDASSNETTTVSYNTETLAGFIISPDYNNGEKSCWDSSLNNITCSS